MTASSAPQPCGNAPVWFELSDLDALVVTGALSGPDVTVDAVAVTVACLTGRWVAAADAGPLKTALGAFEPVGKVSGSLASFATARWGAHWAHEATHAAMAATTAACVSLRDRLDHLPDGARVAFAAGAGPALADGIDPWWAVDGSLGPFDWAQH